MLENQTSFYARWRVRSGVAPLLHEDCESPPECLLQTVWQHQRLLREQLTLLDGQPVRILHPGFRSVEGGPDFRGAVVQVGDGPPQTGDVEVDLRSSGWHAHGHDRNAAFAKVILHVIWDSERPATGSPPVLPLCHSLDAPLGELSLWLGSEAAQELPEQLRGKCCAPLRVLSATQLGELLHQAAEVRLRSKASLFAARARQAGWEQALWEGLFSALGYKHNTWPMQRLAELRPRWAGGGRGPRVEGRGSGVEQGGSDLGAPASSPASFQSNQHAGEDAGAPRSKTPCPSTPDTFPSSSDTRPSTLFSLQARLFGLSGLLPAEVTPAQTDAGRYLRRVWDQWWRERDEFSDCSLPRALWRFHGIRPANHPQRRLALASHWSAAGDLAGRIERWCQREVPPSALAGSLLETLQVGADDFWSWHWTFRSARLKKEQPLLGATRTSDLAMNVVLPWLWVRASEGKNETVCRKIEQRYFSWPLAEDNSLLRLARQRLLGGAPRRICQNAAAQQGLIQIVRDFCEHSNALCENCKLPQMVKELANESIGFPTVTANHEEPAN